MKIRKAIGAIIKFKDKFLLLKRGAILTVDGFEKIESEWDILKGGIDDGETAESALMRELFEETGSKKFIISKKIKEKLAYGLPAKTGFSSQEVEIFIVKYNGDEKDLKTDGKEIISLQFFSCADAVKKIKYPETEEFFRKYAR
jgi:putative (di)nucleoside polyphosphate hydrolase